MRESAHGQLVADWVELFAPLLFDLQRPTAWPTQGSLLLDHMPFRIRAEDASGVGMPGGRVAFGVFSASRHGTRPLDEPLELGFEVVGFGVEGEGPAGGVAQRITVARCSSKCEGSVRRRLQQ